MVRRAALVGPGVDRPIGWAAPPEDAGLCGKVTWCQEVDSGAFQAGIQFQTRLEYHDLFKLT